MITLVDFKPDHVKTIKVQPGQRDIPILEDEYDHKFVKDGYCYTLMLGDKILACGGLAKVWYRRAFFAWAVLAEDCGRYLPEMIKIANRLFELHQDEGRILALVKQDFEQGHRAMRIMGFRKNDTPPTPFGEWYERVA